MRQLKDKHLLFAKPRLFPWAVTLVEQVSALLAEQRKLCVMESAIGSQSRVSAEQAQYLSRRL